MVKILELLLAQTAQRFPSFGPNIIGRNAQRVVFSVRMVKDTAFAQNVTAVPDWRLGSVKAV